MEERKLSLSSSSPPPDMKECPIILRGLVCPFSSGLGNADHDLEGVE